MMQTIMLIILLNLILSYLCFFVIYYGSEMPYLAECSDCQSIESMGCTVRR